jgi:4'-phosphopantetheinyl transferase
MAELSEPQPDWDKPFTLAEDEVHIWYIQANADALAFCQSRLEACLSPQEMEKYLSLKLASVRQNFLLSRGCLRHVLSRYLVIPPRKLKFVFGPYGKPALKDSRKQSALQFNLSHSQARVAIALHGHCPVGIDIEHHRPMIHLEGLCRRCLTPSEAKTVLSLATSQANRRFLQYWTAKEALLKTLGVGLSQPMDQIEVILGNRELSPRPVQVPVAAKFQTDGHQWSGELKLYQWQPEPHYLAALAVNTSFPTLSPRITLHQTNPLELVQVIFTGNSPES